MQANVVAGGQGQFPAEAVVAVPLVIQQALRLVHIGQNLAGTRQQQTAGLRRQKLPADPVHEHGTTLLFQRLQTFGDRRLGQVQGGGCRIDPAVVDHSNEGAQVVEVHGDTWNNLKEYVEQTTFICGKQGVAVSCAA